MENEHWGHHHWDDSESNGESNGNHGYDDNHDESPAMHGHAAYGHYGKSHTVKKMKKVYHTGAMMNPMHHKKIHKGKPIVCDPQYIIRDCYVPRMVPVVHPVVTVNRHIIVNVPQHFYQPMTRNVVVDPGYPTRGGRTPKQL